MLGLRKDLSFSGEGVVDAVDFGVPMSPGEPKTEGGFGGELRSSNGMSCFWKISCQI